jgi:predicted acylesterase/phospholipase RssA
MAEIRVSKPAVEPADVGPDFLGAGKLEDGIGLCLSGGGFRAMLFHLGAFIRLNEVGLLYRINRIASVSGGSIAAGALGVGWKKLKFDDAGVATNLIDMVAAPLLALAQLRIDVRVILQGLLPSLSAANLAAEIYDRHLFQGATLQDLPVSPRFSFTATSLQPVHCGVSPRNTPPTGEWVDGIRPASRLRRQSARRLHFRRICRQCTFDCQRISPSRPKERIFLMPRSRAYASPTEAFMITSAWSPFGSAIALSW